MSCQTRHLVWGMGSACSSVVLHGCIQSCPLFYHLGYISTPGTNRVHYSSLSATIRFTFIFSSTTFNLIYPKLLVFVQCQRPVSRFLENLTKTDHKASVWMQNLLLFATWDYSLYLLEHLRDSNVFKVSIVCKTWKHATVCRLCVNSVHSHQILYTVK